jgi:hypothetical protein
MAAWPPGWYVCAGALIVLVAGALLKVVRAKARGMGADEAGTLQVFVVACVYDLARALAVVLRAPHRSVGQPAATTGS